jgi:hypothetical protein
VSPSAILERERSRALPTALATFTGLAMMIVAIAVGTGGTSSAETEAQLLADFPEDRDPLLIAAILQAAGMALLVAPLFYLFQAASARSEAMRQALIGVTVAGPLFFAVSFILQWVAFDQAAGDFATPGGGLGVPVGEYAEDLLSEQSAFGAAQGFEFAGLLGTVVGVVYTSLHAMRVGLLTRFWGSLGMALGVSLLFLGFLGLLVFFLAVGMLVAGWWPGGRPPAWDEGRAIPWPRPGEGEEEEEEEEGEPTARPEDFVGRKAEEEEEEEVPAAGGAGAAAAGQGGEARRKRKRRR